MKAFKIIGKVLIVVFLSLLVLHIVNERAINHTLETILDSLEESYELEEIQLDTSNAPVIPLVHTQIHKAKIKGLGNLSILQHSLGFLDAFSIILTPLEKDMPLLNVDMTYFTIIRKVNISLIAVVNEKGAENNLLVHDLEELNALYSDVSNDPLPSSWMDTLITNEIDKAFLLNQDEDVNLLLSQLFNLYAKGSNRSPLLDAQQQEERVILLKDFISRLLKEKEFPVSLLVHHQGEEKARSFLSDLLLDRAS